MLNKQDSIMTAIVSLGFALTGKILADQLDIKLQSKKEGEEETLSSSNYWMNTPVTVLETMGGPKQWDKIYDIIVIGSGASGLMAGVSALWANPKLKVVILEKESTIGGTTSKSGGVFWLPNNVKMTTGGDSREETIHLLCRKAYPEQFNSNSPHFGLDAEDYLRICEFYDLGNTLSKQLQEISFHLTRVKDTNGNFLYDYTYSKTEQPDNVSPQQRHLGVGMPKIHRFLLNSIRSIVMISLPALRKFQQRFPQLRELTVLSSFGVDLNWGLGLYLVQVLEKEFTRSGNGTIITNCSVKSLVLDNGAAVGVQVYYLNKMHFFGNKRSLIFASGGYSHNYSFIKRFFIDNGKFLQRSGASKGNTGDFLQICEKLDSVDLQNVDKIWGCEAIYLNEPNESIIQKHNWETPTCLFQLRGDSNFVVGPLGKRIYNEKMKYDLRARVHWKIAKMNLCQDSNKGVFFIIADYRCIDLFGSETLANTFPRDPNDPLYIKGNTLADLIQEIQKKYPQFVDSTQFGKNLTDTFQKFNEFAVNGMDLEFQRGTEFPSDSQWTNSGLTEDNQMPNRSMHPLSQNGPYFALPIVASIIDTKGGPKVDSHGRVLKIDGNYIDRLYAVGNCARPITGDSYLSGGMTLGPALATGYTAGIHAVLRGEGGAKL